MMMAIVAEYSRWFRQIGRKGGLPIWRAQQAVLVKDSAAVATVLGLRNKAFAGIGGRTAPVCTTQDAIYHPNGLPNRTLVIANYETPALPNRAELEFRVVALRTERKIEDTADKIIEGADKNLHQTTWLPLFDNRLAEYQAVIFIKTAYFAKQFSLGSLYNLRKKVNSDALQIGDFGTAAPGTLLFHGIPRGSRKMWDDYYQLVYMLEWSGPDKTWNELCKVRPVAWVVQNDAGVKGKTVFMPMPGYKWVASGATYVLTETKDEYRKPYGTAKFGKYLKGLKTW